MKLKSTLSPVWDEVRTVRSFLDKQKKEYGYHLGVLKSHIDEYMSVFKKIGEQIRYLNIPGSIRKSHISLVESTKDTTRLNELVVELDRFLLDKNFALLIIEKGIKAAEEFKKKASEIRDFSKENSMDFSPGQLTGENVYNKELVELRNYKAKFQEAIPKIGEMERSISKLRGLEDILKSMWKIKRMIGSGKELVPSFKRFINALPYTNIRLSHFRNELNSIKKISEYVIYKLKNAKNLVKYLRIVGPKIKSLSDYQTCCRSDNIEHIISKLIQFKQNVRNKVSYAIRDLNRFTIQGFVIKRQKYPDSFIETIKEIQGKILKNLESYIRKLRVIQTIQENLETIKKKKGKLSSLTSEIKGIKSVEDGITQLKEVQKTIEKFEPIIGTINSIRPLYHFERSKFKDIDEHVGVLMTTKDWLMVLRSDIESYIKFLEEIKGPSRTIEYYWWIKDNLPSIGKIAYRLGLRIWQIIDDLYMIKTNVSEMNMVITTIINISTILIMMYFRLP